MSIRSSRPELGSRLPTTGRGGPSYVLILLVVLVAVVLCVTGMIVARLIRSDRPPATLPAYVSATTAVPVELGTIPVGTPGQPQLEIYPPQGNISTLITVTGRGWWPGEPVFVFLRSQAESEGQGYAYAAAVADDRGSFRTAFTFPNEARWVGESSASVVARGMRSNLESAARFDLVTPTPTSTLPPSPTRLAPTATATTPTTPTPVPTQTPTAVPVITDWLGQYYAGLSLGGDPLLVRNDVAIDFNWGVASPAAQVPADQFSARWTRRLSFSEGYYRFVVSADDGVRLWLDEELILDEWHDGVTEDLRVERYLSGGQHSLRLEYYENSGGAMVQLAWGRIELPTATPSPSLPSPTPSATTQPTETPSPPLPPEARALPESWQGEYYANPFLEGSPALVRTDPAVAFDWGMGSPAEGLPEDVFSVRWTGSQWMQAGNYRYSILADDGFRLWIDEQLLLDAWQQGPGQRLSTTASLPEGTHTFRVDYYEVNLRAMILLSGEKLPGAQSSLASER